MGQRSSTPPRCHPQSGATQIQNDLSSLGRKVTFRGATHLGYPTQPGTGYAADTGPPLTVRFRPPLLGFPFGADAHGPIHCPPRGRTPTTVGSLGAGYGSYSTHSSHSDVFCSSRYHIVRSISCQPSSAGTKDNPVLVPPSRDTRHQGPVPTVIGPSD